MLLPMLMLMLMLLNNSQQRLKDVTTQFPPSATMRFGHALQHCTQATVCSTRRPTCPGHALQRWTHRPQYAAHAHLHNRPSSMATFCSTARRTQHMHTQVATLCSTLRVPMKPTKISHTLHYAAHACVHDVQATLFTIHHGSLENKWTHTHTHVVNESFRC